MKSETMIKLKQCFVSKDTENRWRTPSPAMPTVLVSRGIKTTQKRHKNDTNDCCASEVAYTGSSTPIDPVIVDINWLEYPGQETRPFGSHCSDCRRQASLNGRYAASSRSSFCGTDPVVRCRTDLGGFHRSRYKPEVTLRA